MNFKKPDLAYETFFEGKIVDVIDIYLDTFLIEPEVTELWGQATSDWLRDPALSSYPFVGGDWQVKIGSSRATKRELKVMENRLDELNDRILKLGSMLGSLISSTYCHYRSEEQSFPKNLAQLHAIQSKYDPDEVFKRPVCAASV